MIYRTLFALLAIIMSVTGIQAQTYYDQQKQNREYKNLQSATQRAYNVPSGNNQSSATSQSSSSGSSSSGSRNSSGSYINTNTSAPAFRSASEIAAQKQQQLKADQEERDLHAKRAAERARRDAIYEKDRNEYLRKKSDERDEFVNSLEVEDYGSVVDRYDRLDWYRDRFFVKEAQWKEIDRSAASEAYISFLNLQSTGSYEDLCSLVWDARFMPFSAEKCIHFLLEKFPEKRESTELLELATKIYFFGANRPQIYLGCCYTPFYPATLMEHQGVPNNLRYGVVERFIELAKKFPEDGLEAAGFCRPHINPFIVFAKANNSDEALKDDMYWRAIHTRVARRGIDYEGEPAGVLPTDDKAVMARRQLEIPATWLVENRDARLQSLSKEDWLEIAERQNISAYHLASVFHNPKGDGSLRREYKNLTKAVKSRK